MSVIGPLASTENPLFSQRSMSAAALKSRRCRRRQGVVSFSGFRMFRDQPMIASDPIAEYRATIAATLPRLRQIYGFASLGIFGSRLRGDHRPKSDLDLLGFVRSRFGHRRPPAAGTAERAVHAQTGAAIIRSMSISVITIPVDASTADAYQSASADQQRRLQLLLRLRLRELTTQPVRSLAEICDEVGRAAAEKGLTPESLSSILDER